MNATNTLLPSNELFAAESARIWAVRGKESVIGLLRNREYFETGGGEFPDHSIL